MPRTPSPVQLSSRRARSGSTSSRSPPSPSGHHAVVDIRTTGGLPTAQEMPAVDEVLGPPTSLGEGGARRLQDDHIAFGGHATRSQRHLLLPVLHGIQDRVGWVSRGALEYACRRLSIPPAEDFRVVSVFG